MWAEFVNRVNLKSIGKMFGKFGFILLKIRKEFSRKSFFKEIYSILANESEQ